MAYKNRHGTRKNKRARRKLKAAAIQRIQTREANVKQGLRGVVLESDTPSPGLRMRVELGKKASSINSTDFNRLEREKSRGELKTHEKTYKRFSKVN